MAETPISSSFTDENLPFYGSQPFEYTDSTPFDQSQRSSIQPVSFERAPLNLKRAGKGGLSQYVIYSIENRSEFLEWWKTTDYVDTVRQKPYNWATQLTSKYWDYFLQIADQDTGLPKAICKQCNAILEHPNWLPGRPGNGTSGLKRHLPMHANLSKRKEHNQRLISNAFEDVVSNRTQLDPLSLTNLCSFNLQKTKGLEKAPFTTDGWYKVLLRFISRSKLPFRIVEHPDFHEVINYARLSSVPPVFPDRTTLARYLNSVVEDTERSLLDSLPSGSKISIALDCWTSPFQQAFIAITGYFIDDSWAFRKVLLAFEPLYGTHSGSQPRHQVDGGP
jgi:hypothetical protein